MQIVLKALKLLSFLSIFFILSLNGFSQVPLNGFCRLTTYNIQSEFEFFQTINYNSDSFTDLIFFNPFDKNVVIKSGLDPGGFGTEISKRSQMELSSIKPIFNRNRRVDSYAFVSRKNRTVGTLYFNKNGQPVVNNYFRFNSFPGNLSTSFFNNDDSPDILVSGSGFSGISFLSVVNGKLKERKLVDKGSFKIAEFIELNNDEFIDIAAYNNMDRNIYFFYNDGLGNCREARRLPFENHITDLKVFDINSDSYKDIIFSYANHIKILYGDFQSSFESTLTIETQYKVDDFLIADYNQDGYFDLTYVYKEEGIISTFFSQAGEKYFDEVLHLRKPSIKQILPYFSRNITGVIYYTDFNEFGTITKLNRLLDSFTLTTAIEPEDLNYFEGERKGDCNFTFYDKFDRSLKVLIRSVEGIPKFFYKIPLVSDPIKIVVDDEHPYRKTFFCYKGNTRVFEEVRIDFEKDKIARSQHYSPGEIIDLDLILKKDKPNGYKVLFKNKNRIGLYEKEGEKITENRVVETKLISPILLPSKDNNISFWQRDGTSFRNFNLDRSLKKEEKIKLNFIPQKMFTSKSKTGAKFQATVSMLSNSVNNFVVVLSDSIADIFDVSSLSNQLRIKNKKHLFFGFVNQNDEITVFVYSDNENKLKSLLLNRKTGKIKLKNLLNVTDVEEFFVTNLNFKNLHLVYIDGKDNLIKIKEL